MVIQLTLKITLSNSCSLPEDSNEPDRFAFHAISTKYLLHINSLPIWHCSMQRLLVSLKHKRSQIVYAYIVTVALIILQKIGHSI